MSLGIPLKLLQESVGHIVTVELDSGTSLLHTARVTDH